MSGHADSIDTPEASPGSVERIERTATGELLVYLAGRDQPVRRARIARCFPWSVPERYISVCDEHGNELALLDGLDELDPDSRAVALDEMQRMVFNPKILRVLEFKHEFGLTTITAETDRGQVSFQIRSRDDVRILSPTRALFRDVDGNTYELPDLTALDASSRRDLRVYF